MAERTALYRLYSEGGQLLHVGIADNPERRWKQHSLDKPWWSEVADRKIEWHSNRCAAHKAETEAIKSEAPRFNRLGTPECGAEQSRRQLATRSERQVKGRIVSDASRLGGRVASKLQALGYSSDHARAVGMLAERAYKEASGAFPAGVAYPPLARIEAILSRVAA